MKITEIHYRIFVIIFLIANSIISGNIIDAQTERNLPFNVLKLGNPQKYFRYRGDGSVIVSGHRGGREKGYPENSLEGFQNVLRQMPAFFEIDPRLTKDSIIVLLHDTTLDRTTTGTGLLCDYTWDQLKSVRLKDSEGNVTSYSIPTLEDAIKWSRGKTVINLDKKDVPMEMIVGLIKKLHAVRHVMLTVHNGQQARYYYDHLPNIMLSAFTRTLKEYEDIAASGVPWRNMIAYVGPAINNDNRKIVDLLHEKNVRCMISVVPTHDKLATTDERYKAYLEELIRQPDIVESDIPTEIRAVLQSQ
jgi:glycerophosphoryl diester phosphodiesterase